MALASPGAGSALNSPSHSLLHRQLDIDTGATEGSVTINSTDDLLVNNGDLGVTGTRVKKIWATDLQVTNAIAGSITGNAGTVTTITGLAPDTATTQATQASITTCANLTTVGTLTTGNADAVVTDATTSAKGKVELAIASEVDTGTDATRAVTPDSLQGSKRNIRWLVFNLVEAATDCATATNIAGDFVSPIAGVIQQSDTTPFYLYATNSTAGTNTGVGLVVDISIGGTSIMTTNKLDFDTTEKTTTTAATPPDLTTTALAVGDIITIDIDSIHDGTPAKGLIVYMAVLET